MQQQLHIILFMKLEFWANSQDLHMYRLYLHQHHPSIDPKQILVTISIRNGTFTVMLERKLNWRDQFFASMLGGSSPQSIILTGQHFFRIFNLQGRPHDLSHQTLGILHPSSTHPLLNFNLKWQMELEAILEEPVSVPVEGKPKMPPLNSQDKSVGHFPEPPSPRVP